ncbi:MAG: L-seryl-tRNA selenium transferase, partial [Acidobacteria bacterium]|nr:L-seryl-tRNA selenium transferase [Acidobacteriota bacterium]
DPNAPANEHHEEHRSQRDPNSFGFAVWQLKDGEDKTIAERLVEILKAAPKA